jgi:hypothetical protein
MSNQNILDKIISGLKKEGEYTISDFTHYVNDFKNYNGIKCWEDSLKCMLANLNASTYNYRYRHEPEKDITYFIHKDIKVSAIEFIKALDYFIYQCSESSNKENGLLKRLRNISNYINSSYISKLEEYSKIEWGE